MVESIDSAGNLRWVTQTVPHGAYALWRGIRPVIGADGSVYFALAQAGNISSIVLGFDEKTGAVTLSRGATDITGLHAYSQGLILVVTDSEVEYVAYDNALLHSYSTGPAISDYVAYSNASGADGTVYVAGYEGSPGACSSSDVASVEEFTASGMVWSWSDSSMYCSQTALAATPDGGVIFARTEPGNLAVFTSLSASGIARWTHGDSDPNSAFAVGVPIVDVNGTVALPSHNTQTCSTNGGNYCVAGRVDFVSQAADTAVLPSREVADPAGSGYALIGIAGASDRLYTFGYDGVGGTNIWQVSAFAAPGFAEDYRIALQRALEPPDSAVSGGSGGGGGAGTTSEAAGGGASPVAPLTGNSGGNWGGGENSCSPPPAIGRNISLNPTGGTLPDGSTATFLARVSKLVVLGQPGKRVTFKIDCGPNASHTASAMTDVRGEARFAAADKGGSGVDTISASFADSSGATERATSTVRWAAPVRCGYITPRLGFVNALKCAAAQPMVHTLLQVGECAVDAASFFAPPLKFARLLGLVGKAKSLEELVRWAKVPRPLARLILALHRAYGDKLNPSARPGFQSFHQLSDTLQHVQHAADFMRFLPYIWAAVRKNDVSEIALDVADLTGLTPCVELADRVVT